MTTNAATGPKTTEGKRIASRNATTHGLFARDVVLPHLGEDPAGYEALHLELAAELRPASLLEKHYVEKIAAASWRLRRLHRWQAQVLEDPALTDDEALSQLDRVMRHETTLHRQIDTAVRLLGREVPQLVEGRARRAALTQFQVTEAHCRQNPSLDRGVADEARRTLAALAVRPLPAVLHARPEMLDNAAASPHPLPEGEVSGLAQSEGFLPEGFLSEGPPSPPELRAGGRPAPFGISALRRARKVKQHQKCRNEQTALLAPHQVGGGGRAGGGT